MLSGNERSQFFHLALKRNRRRIKYDYIGSLSVVFLIGLGIYPPERLILAYRITSDYALEPCLKRSGNYDKNRADIGKLTFKKRGGINYRGLETIRFGLSQFIGYKLCDGGVRYLVELIGILLERKCA